MVLLKKYAASQCHRFEREWRLSALFNPVYFSDCHTCIDIQVRAQERGLSEAYVRIAGDLNPVTFLHDLRTIFPMNEEGYCYFQSLWTAQMASCVGFSEVELITCIPYGAKKTAGAFCFHTAVCVEGWVMDPYLGQVFESPAEWISYLNTHEIGDTSEYAVREREPMSYYDSMFDRWWKYPIEQSGATYAESVGMLALAQISTEGILDQDRVISVSSLSIAYYAHHLQEGVYMLFHTEKIPDEIA